MNWKSADTHCLGAMRSGTKLVCVYCLFGMYFNCVQYCWQSSLLCLLATKVSVFPVYTALCCTMTCLVFSISSVGIGQLLSNSKVNSSQPSSRCWHEKSFWYYHILSQPQLSLLSCALVSSYESWECQSLGMRSYASVTCIWKMRVTV